MEQKQNMLLFLKYNDFREKIQIFLEKRKILVDRKIDNKKEDQP